MNNLKVVLLGLALFSLTVSVHATTLSTSCQHHAKNIIQVSIYAFMCLDTDALGWGDKEDRAFERLESQVATACEDTDEQAMGKLADSVFSDLEGLNSETQLIAYCHSVAPTVRSILHQYK